MASVKKGKKVVNQDELRRLMRAKKLSGERQKRVESPYAKYNCVGHLSCVLCNVQVKSELLWQTHVLGKQHRDKVSELKNKSSSSSSSVLKREAPADTSSSSSSVKRVKLQDAAGVTAKLQEGKAASSHRSAGLGLLAGHYDDDDEDMDTSSKTPVEDAAPAATTGTLPADFFDSSVHAVSHSGSVSKAGDDGETAAAEKKDNTAEALPEGFFDDPVRDAKVRNVDTPKDQLDKEWEEFQKEMRQVNSASDAIVAEDDEEGRLERQIDEIDEQIECFRRVEVLRAKQEVVKSTMMKEKWQRDETQQSGSDEEDDEEELMHVLTQDWRAKGALA